MIGECNAINKPVAIECALGDICLDPATLVCSPAAPTLKVGRNKTGYCLAEGVDVA